MNKKLLLLPISAFVLAACGGSEGESTDRGGSNPPEEIQQPQIENPENFSEEMLSLNQEKDSVTLNFSLDPKEDSFYIYSPKESNDIEQIRFNLEHKDGLEDYLVNYPDLTNKISQLGDQLINDREAQLTVKIDDLPADMYQNQDDMNAERVISGILKINMQVDNGIGISRDFELNYQNENELPALPRFFESSFEFNENTTNYITVPIEDSNKNDNLTYSISVNNPLQFMSFDTDQECEGKNQYELINCVIPKGVERNAIIKIDTGEVANISESEGFEFSFTDQSGSLIDGEGFNNKNEVSRTFNVDIINDENDLTPSVEFNTQSGGFNISELNGGVIEYNLIPADNRPNDELSVSFNIDLDGLDVGLQHDEENNRFVFDNINIAEDKIRTLRVEVSDGQFSSYNEASVTFVDDIDRMPSLSINNGLQQTINESTGGEIGYTTTLNNPERSISVTGSLSIDNVQYNLVHNQENQVFELSDIRATSGETGFLTVTASDGVESVSREVEIQIDNDIEPFVDIQDQISISDGSESLSTYSFISGIENNTQNREFTIDYSFAVPEGVVFNFDSNSNLLEFDVNDLYTRENIERDLTITVSDGVSQVETTVDVLFTNDVDKEMRDFEEMYDENKSNYNQMVSINAEEVLMDFYQEVALIKGNNNLVIEEIAERGKSLLDEQKVEMDELISDLDNFVSTTTKDDPGSLFEPAYEKLSSLDTKMKNYGLATLFDINELAVMLSMPELERTENFKSENGVYGRYVGNTLYGSYVDFSNDEFRFNEGFKMLDLVNPNQVCN